MNLSGLGKLHWDHSIGNKKEATQNIAKLVAGQALYEPMSNYEAEGVDEITGFLGQSFSKGHINLALNCTEYDCSIDTFRLLEYFDIDNEEGQEFQELQ